MKLGTILPRVITALTLGSLALAFPACADREHHDSPTPGRGEVRPVSAGKLTKSTITMPREGKSIDVLEKLPASERAKIDESFVPVLVPRTPSAEVHIVVEPGFYTYSGTMARTLPDGRVSRATVSVQGTRFAHEHEGFPQDVTTHAMRGSRGLFTINEGITTTTWVENGAGYSVDVECSISDDTRCRDEAFVLEVTQGLAFVGGRP